MNFAMSAPEEETLPAGGTEIISKGCAFSEARS